MENTLLESFPIAHCIFSTSEMAIHSDHLEEKNVSIALHHCSFVNWEASAVVAISPDCRCSGNRFVLARENGDLETHSAFLGWGVEHYIPNTIKQGNKPITSIVELVQDVVITATLDGFLTIWDMVKRTQQLQLCPGGGAIWCMEMDPTTQNKNTKTLAIGCEDGRVRLIHVVTSGRLVEQSVSVELFPDAGPSRVLAVGWSLQVPNKCLLATDDSGNIRKLDMQWKRCVQVMKITQSGLPVVIWGVVALHANSNHHYYATGDSRGIVTIWDANNGCVINEFAVENCKGDITCLTSIVVAENSQNVHLPEMDIFVGAADGGIGAIRGHLGSQQLSNHYYDWSPVRGRSLHARDVRTIKAIGNDRIVSGGADFRVCIMERNDLFSESKCIRLYPSRKPHRPSCARYICQKDLLIAEHDQYVDIWKGIASMNHQMLFRYRQRDGTITASALSNDGCWFAVATMTRIRIYQMQLAQNGLVSVQVEPFRVISSHGARDLLWIQKDANCSCLLVIANQADGMFLYTTNENSTPIRIQWASLVPCIAGPNHASGCSITCMSTANREEKEMWMFAVGDQYGNVFLFDVRYPDIPVVSLQGCLSEPVCCMSLQQNVLIVCGCRGQVQLFRIEMEKYKVERMVSWSEKSMEWLKEQLIVSLDFLPIYGVDIDVDASCFLIYGHYYILLVHWNHLEEVIENTIDHSESRRWNKTWNPNANEEQRSSVIQRIHKLPTKKLKVMYPLENVAYVGFMRQEKGKQQPTDNTIPILCLEHRWEDMLSQMPPALLQKKFGI